ncbi:MAG TPA: NAD(P)-binding domain-containing protein [Candidatus Saccharimonadales bacterium]|nr:NAD(P)-binding domain-containing protein [Candidatus Saccharimonadales bacterium]
MATKHDLIIIGSGQAGLAAAYDAHTQGLDYLALEAHDNIGDSWRERYDSLTLFTPRKYSNLAGMDMPGEEWDYPTKDEVADYLQQYADHFDLKVALGQHVTRLAHDGENFVITTSKEEFTAQNVVAATGPFQTPRIPEWSKQLDQNVKQLHSSQYHNPDDIDGESVLVVGGGNSGAQIVAELAADHKASLSVAEKPIVIPAQLLGKSLFWWLDKVGALSAPADSLRTKLFGLQKGIPVIGTDLQGLLKQGKLDMLPRAVGAEGQEVLFEDGSRQAFDTVIWSTGFTQDYSWLQVPNALDDHGKPAHHDGISSTVDNLYYLGQTWQRTINSALLGGVKYDARFIVSAIQKHKKS